MKPEKIIIVIVSLAIGLSFGTLLNGHPERGVLFCLWASLVVGLYGVLK